MKRRGGYALFVCLLLTGVCQQAYATHYRAGEILYQVVGDLKITATIITYAKWSAPSNQADRDTVVIAWGDGTFSVLPRNNGPDSNPADGYPDGVFVAPDIKKNIYTGTHQYPGLPPGGYFVVSFLDQNRMAGINNIAKGNSVEIPFYVEDTIKFPTDVKNIGVNSSPVLYHPPIDYANVNDTFVHNPLAIDSDGDSLDFQLMQPLQNQGINVPGYQYPGAYCMDLGHSSTITIDKHTGQIVWATPCVMGFFNIAILIHEYRNGINVGTLERDMQIIVLDIVNDPPQITHIPDTCIRAGDTLIKRVSASDRQLTQRVTLTADGGPMRVANSPAKFTSTAGNPANGTFTWFTVCDHIQKQPYMVLFDAEDNYSTGSDPAHLVDLEPWLINVIPPPVENLTATVNHSTVNLSWQNPYKCASSTNFRGFSVWRKIGCDPFTPDYCETGLAGRGYTKLTTANILTYNYTDNTAVIGQAYSYRVVAEFYKLPPSQDARLKYDLQESVASNEVCIFVPISLPVIINVSVTNTDETNGQIFVRWTKPIAGGTHLDTIQNPPPYRFDIYRSKGLTIGNNATLIHSTPDAASFTALSDTTFTDTQLDTKTTGWTYRVFFYSNNDTIGSTEPASSIYLHVSPSDKSLNLNWQENVPWLNDSFSIFKLNKLTTLFDSIAVSYTHTYADTGLVNDSTYCYYVKGYGHYTVTSLPTPLINLSEQDCAVPSDTTAPCPPVLTVHNDCDNIGDQPWDTSLVHFINHLLWMNPFDSCAFDIASYHIYFGADTAALSLLTTTATKNDTLYDHLQSDNLAGCYAVTAIDKAGNQSQFSNIVCVDNCPFYILPNAFTPNGDGSKTQHNDYFHPLYRHRFVQKVEIQIFNRWGDKVFETTDPDINWDGKDQKTGKDCSEGVYLYAGYYFEEHSTGLVRKPLGNKNGGGFIHLIRGK